MRGILTLSVLGSLLAISACTKPQTASPIVTNVVEVSKPAPILPNVDQLNLRDVQWVIITADNAAEILQPGVVYFALTPQGYENIAMNLSDIMTILEQQQKVIVTYEKQF